MKNALVTGGSRGIGKAIAHRLEKAGFEVICPKRAELDLSQMNSVQNFLHENRDLVIDVLVNNAGENIVQNIVDIDFTVWNTIQNTNVNSAFLLTQSFGKKMLEKKSGKVLNIGSIFSAVTREGRASYATSKSALVGFTRTAAVEWARYNVLVNALSPGFVDTELTRKNNSPEKIAEICKSLPIGRLASVEEIAELAYFLVSDANTFMTGQNVIADGGFTLI